jgi:DNA-binding transcriptional ArsR family regulator
MSRARSSAAAKAKLQSAAPIFAALADETRLGLVAQLCEGGPSSTTRLAAGTRVTRQAITKHLRMMEAAGLVHVTREGRETLWELEPRRLEDARRYLDAISAQWDGALARLKAFVEK